MTTSTQPRTRPLPTNVLAESEIAGRKAFLEFTPDDEAKLKDMTELAGRCADEVIEAFYRHLLKFDDTKAFFRDPTVLQRVKRAQQAYFLRLTQGNYDQAYVADRLRIGAVHESVGLPIKPYLGMYCFYLRTIAERLLNAFRATPPRAFGTLNAFLKLTFLDMGLAIDTYIESRERTIRAQQEAIRELSTPVLPVRPGLMILPIVGVMDSQRANQLTEQLLSAIRAGRAKVVVIDLTGVPGVDSRVASHLIQTCDAARLVGATTIFTGLAPEIAQMMVTLGIDLGAVRTVGDLQAGVEQAERLLGYRAIRINDERPACK